MSILDLIVLAASCLLASQPVDLCSPIVQAAGTSSPQVAGARASSELTVPQHTGASLDVVLTAQSALAWDVATGTILYEKNAVERRPVASLTKLLSALVVRDVLPPDSVVTIPPDVRRSQARGAHIKLPVGGHARVSGLLAAGLIASANDAFTALAVAAYGSEDVFAEHATSYAHEHGFRDTQMSNATGLTGGEQYSTATDLKNIFATAYTDPLLRSYLGSSEGTLHTDEGQSLHYTTTNELLGTYLPIYAGKTGYTVEAGQNVIIMTEGPQGQHVGIVVLGSDARFQEAKVLAEWLWRNYTWKF